LHLWKEFDHVKDQICPFGAKHPVNVRNDARDNGQSEDQNEIEEALSGIPKADDDCRNVHSNHGNAEANVEGIAPIVDKQSKRKLPKMEIAFG
jgi:hypothetical protein